MNSLANAEKIAKVIRAVPEENRARTFHLCLIAELGRILSQPEQDLADTVFLVGYMLGSEKTIEVVHQEAERAGRLSQNPSGQTNGHLPALSDLAGSGPVGGPGSARTLPAGLPTVVRATVSGEEETQ